METELVSVCLIRTIEEKLCPKITKINVSLFLAETWIYLKKDSNCHSRSGDLE